MAVRVCHTLARPARSVFRAMPMESRFLRSGGSVPVPTNFQIGIYYRGTGQTGLTSPSSSSFALFSLVLTG